MSQVVVRVVSPVNRLPFKRAPRRDTGLGDICGQSTGAVVRELVSTTAGNQEELQLAVLTPAARRRVFHLRARAQQAGHSEEVLALESGGLRVLYAQQNGREVSFVLPSDAHVLYFVARTPEDDIVASGIVDDDAAISRLTHWIGSTAATIPIDGLRVG